MELAASFFGLLAREILHNSVREDDLDKHTFFWSTRMGQVTFTGQREQRKPQLSSSSREKLVGGWFYVVGGIRLESIRRRSCRN